MPTRLPLRWGSALALGLGTTFCHPAARVTPPTPATTLDACALSGTDSTWVPDTLVIGVPGAVDPAHAPIPGSDAERTVFRQLYETLIRIDCTGQARPGLANSWSASESGMRWTFTLRDGATFWDGSTVTAADVIASWQSSVLAEPQGFEAVALGEQVIGVRLREPTTTVPLVFADPGMAVTRSVPDQDWPAGTGTYSAGTSAGRVIVTPLRGGQPVLVLRSSGAGDARDLLDAGVDLLVTDDPAALSYAADRPG
ncbi:MAG TPA: ABC transporter substrate-binding protein, partial [Gemmatimonadales bacterium]